MTETVFKLPCGKCGVGIPVDEQMVTNALALGMPLQPEHEVCPGATAPEGDDAEPLARRRFRLQLIACEILTSEDPELSVFMPTVTDGVEVLAGVGTTVEADNFPEAVNGAMTVWLAQHWPKFQESAAFADLPPTTTAPPA